MSAHLGAETLSCITIISCIASLAGYIVYGYLFVVFYPILGKFSLDKMVHFYCYQNHLLITVVVWKIFDKGARGGIFSCYYAY